MHAVYDLVLSSCTVQGTLDLILSRVYLFVAFHVLFVFDPFVSLVGSARSIV